jgi:hypothetical protein
MFQVFIQWLEKRDLPRQRQKPRCSLKSDRVGPLESGDRGAPLDLCGRRLFCISPSLAFLEAIAVVAGLDNFASIRESIEQRSGHLGVAEHSAPFA